MRAVNLIPSEHRSGAAVGSRSEGAVFAVLGLLAGLVVLAGVYGLAHHELSSRRAEAAELTARAQQVQAQAAELASYTSFVSMREQRLQAISQLVGSRFDWASAMGELSRVLPADVALSSLQGTIGSTSGTSSSTTSSSSSSSSTTTAGAGAAISSATPPGMVPTVTLSGCASSQSVVAQTLVRLRLMSGVSAVELLSSTKSSSGGGSGASGTCPDGYPVFSAQVTFEPLPAPPTSDVGALEAAAAPGSASGSAGHSGRVLSSTARVPR
jgi:Tfp pilus assembly protein PilN